MKSNQVELIGAIGSPTKAQDGNTYQPYRFRYVTLQGKTYTVDVEVAKEQLKNDGEEAATLLAYSQAYQYFYDKLIRNKHADVNQGTLDLGGAK